MVEIDGGPMDDGGRKRDGKGERACEKVGDGLDWRRT